MFIIGGGVSKAGEYLLEKVISKYKNYIAFEGLKNVHFTLAKLGNDAGMYGAASLI